MQAAQKNTGVKYTRRKPETTPCYKIVQNHLDSFIMARQSEGRPLPEYVIGEFEAYLKCGILAHGFLRLKCKDCTKEKIVAFSCKKRGFCPRCAAKRMIETAVHLTENVLPLVPYFLPHRFGRHEFVISFPIPLRYWLNTNKKLFSKIHKIAIDQVHGYYKQKAKELGVADPTPGKY